MASEAPTPRTDIISPPIAGLPKTYKSTRVVPPESPLPARGSALGNLYGPAYATNIVLDANKINDNGRIFEVIIHCEALPGPVMTGSTKVRELNAAVSYTEQIVPAGAFGTTDPNTTYQPIDEAKSFKRTEIPPTAVLNAFHQQFPSSQNFDIPPVLVSVDCVWHEDKGEGVSESDWRGIAVGASRSLSGNESNNVQSSAALIPEIMPVIRHIPSSRVPTTSHFFYLPMPVTVNDILSKTGASAAWPVFKPEEITFILKGSKLSIQASASASAAFSTSDNAETGSVDLTKGKGSSFDTSPMTNAVTIPATIHGAISVTNPTHADIEITATANAGWTGDAGTALEGATGTPSWDSVAGMPSVTSESEVEGIVSASISPTSIGATTPPSIPTTGIYLVDSKVEPYDWGYARVYAETVNASVFA